MGKYSIQDLIRVVGMTPAGIHYYVRRRVIPRPEGRGPGLLYTDEHLLRLRAACRLRAQRESIDSIRLRLDRASPEELRRLAGDPPAVPAAPVAPASGALQVTSTEPVRIETAAGAAAPSRETAAASADPYTAQRWERIELLPGLELHVRADGGALLTRLAKEIHQRYGVRPS